MSKEWGRAVFADIAAPRRYLVCARQIAQRAISKSAEIAVVNLAYGNRPASAGTFAAWRVFERHLEKGRLMNQLIYLVGLVVVIIAILSFFGLR